MKLIRVMAKMVLTATVVMVAIESMKPNINRRTKRRIKRCMKVTKSMIDTFYSNAMLLLD